MPFTHWVGPVAEGPPFLGLSLGHSVSSSGAKFRGVLGKYQGWVGHSLRDTGHISSAVGLHAVSPLRLELLRHALAMSTQPLALYVRHRGWAWLPPVFQMSGMCP